MSPLLVFILMAFLKVCKCNVCCDGCADFKSVNISALLVSQQSGMVWCAVLYGCGIKCTSPHFLQSRGCWHRVCRVGSSSSGGLFVNVRLYCYQQTYVARIVESFLFFGQIHLQLVLVFYLTPWLLLYKPWPGIACCDRSRDQRAWLAS